MEFGAAVLMREPGERKHKLAILWEKGCWLGRSADTGNHIIGGATSVERARAVTCLATEAERWGKAIFEKMIRTPWATAEKELNLIGEEWMPTAGYRRG